MSGSDMICGSAFGVVIGTILDFSEVVSQVHGYLGGTVDLVHQTLARYCTLSATMSLPN